MFQIGQTKKIYYFFVQCFQNFNFFFQNFSNLHERSGIDRIERKTKFPVFEIFISRVLVIFLLKMIPIFEEFSPITRKMKIEKKYISVFILFSTFRIFHKYLTISGGEGGRGLHILSWEKAYILVNYVHRERLCISIVQRSLV